MLTFNLLNGYLKFFISGTEVAWQEIIQMKYNLSSENYHKILIELNDVKYDDVMKKTLLNNFKVIYHLDFKHQYEFTSGRTIVKSSKPAFLNNKSYDTICVVKDKSGRNFNYLTVEQAIKSADIGIPIACSGDSTSCIMGG